MKWLNKITEFLLGTFVLSWFFTGCACVLFGIRTPDFGLFMLGVLLLAVIFCFD